MNISCPRFCVSKQQGAALITALVILVALTVIGVSAFKSTNLDELMAGNLRDQQLAFEAAESALRDGEDNIAAFTSIPTPLDDGSDGVFTRDRFGDYSALAYTASVWNEGQEYGATGTVDLAEVAADPVFIVEYENFYPDDLNPETRARGQGRFYYRITSRGVGSSQNSATLLQETYGKRYH